MVKIGYLYRQKYSAFICIIICLFLSCAPRANRWGLPQYEYTYQVPEKIEDDWEISDLEAEGVDPKRINELMENILKGDIKNIHSILLVKNGKLIFEEYFYGYDRDTTHFQASVSKSITSILVGIAIDQKLAPDVKTKVYNLFSKYKDTKWIYQKYPITLQHLLTMTAGVDWDAYTYPRSNPLQTTHQMYDSKDPVEFVLERNAVEAPGVKFNYNSGLTILLGEVIKNTSGMYIDEFSGKFLFRPLGISNFYWDKFTNGTVQTDGGLHLRPRDMAKIGYMMLKNGKWRGRQIVSKEWVIESTNTHTTHDFGYGYGYQWRSVKTTINNKEIDMFWASGTGGQRIFVIPTLDLIAVFTSKVFGNPLGGSRTSGILKHYIIPSMLPPTPSRKIIQLRQETLDGYVGKYISKFSNIPLIVYRRGEKLNISIPTISIIELFPESEYRFFGISKEIGDIQLDFTKDAKGNIQKVIVHIMFGRIQCEKIE